MGKVIDGIDEALSTFLRAQPVFFVATAPTALDGMVNVSPKGLDGSFAVRGAREVAYLDLTGSAAETIAHLRDNGRICLMFCAFDGPPRIVRLHGRGEAVTLDDPRFPALAASFADIPGARSVVRVDVTRISDSCGFAVPRMTLFCRTVPSGNTAPGRATATDKSFLAFGAPQTTSMAPEPMSTSQHLSLSAFG